MSLGRVPRFDHSPAVPGDEGGRLIGRFSEDRLRERDPGLPKVQRHPESVRTRSMRAGRAPRSGRPPAPRP